MALWTAKINTKTKGVQYLTVSNNMEKLCPECNGGGYWDSCFHCGNKGVVKKKIKKSQVNP